jgi:hypothetical protein
MVFSFRYKTLLLLYILHHLNCLREEPVIEEEPEEGGFISEISRHSAPTAGTTRPTLNNNLIRNTTSSATNATPEDINKTTDMTLFRRIYQGNIKNYLEKDKNVKFFGNETCLAIHGALGVADMVRYNNYIIGSSNDNLNMWFITKNVGSVPSGSIVLIDIAGKKIKKLSLAGFPQDIAFHPYGLSIYKDKLYVINNSYNKGGQRIELFQLLDKNNSLALKYLKSIPLDSSFMGRLGDIAAIGDEKFYITTEYPFKDDLVLGRNRTEAGYDAIIERFVDDTKDTFVYYCTTVGSSKADCKPISQTASLMNKGIAFDNKNKLYVSHLIERTINVYEISESDPTVLRSVRNITSDYATSNLNYDNKENRLYGAMMGKVGEFTDFFRTVNATGKLPEDIQLSGGGLVVDLKNDKINYILNQNTLHGINSMLVVDRNVLISSWFDDGILLCKLK